MAYKEKTTIPPHAPQLFLIGECLVDILIDPLGHEHRLFGGSPANIAVNTKQLGMHPILCATIGRDDHGDYLLDNLKKRALSTALIHRHLTRTSKVVMHQTSGSPIPTFYRGCDYEIDFSDAMVETLSTSQVLHFSYWPLTKNPAKKTVLMLIDEAKRKNIKIAFDPNVHAALVSDETLSKAALFDLLKQVDIIKPSLDDAHRLFGDRVDKEIYMDRFERFGIDLIMMTLGKDGVYVSDRGSRKLYPSQARTVIDSTGAGDAFWSGFYAGYLHGRSIDFSIKMAQTTSALALKQIGAITELPSLEFLTAYVEGGVTL